MTTIVTRAGKGSPLTNVEVDANFTNLNNDKLEKTGGTITANSSSAALTITQTGTGNAFVVEDQASDTFPFVIDQNGDVGVGFVPTGFKFSVAQTAATHAVASLYNADATATYNTDLQINNGNVVGNALISRRTNGEFWMYTSAAHPIAFWTNSAERLRIDSSGNVLVKSAAGLGYGIGAGGTVTQATSKYTAVTLNKPTGQITMNNAALAAGTQVSFTLINSLITVNDLILVNVRTPTAALYSVRAGDIASGSCLISLTNVSGGPLSDAVVISFAIIKGAVA